MTLFNEKIGFVNPNYAKKFIGFLDYSEKYDKIMKGIPCQKAAPIALEINKEFKEKMTLGRVELPISAL